MDAVYVPLFSALGGALIGSAASIATILIQLRSQERKESIRLATEMASEDYRNQVDAIKHNESGGRIAPLSTFVHYQVGLLRLIEDDNLTPENLIKLTEENSQITDKLLEWQHAIASKRREQKEPAHPK